MTLIKRINKSRKSASTGLPPGEILYTGRSVDGKTNASSLIYNDAVIEEIQGIPNNTEVDKGILWMDIRGINEADLLQKLGQMYNMHPLVLEDVADIFQRPKFDEFEDALFFTLRAVYLNEEKEIVQEHMAVYLGQSIVLSFQETDSDEFGAVRERLLQSRGRIRSRNADYLLYTLIDLIVDKYFITLEDLGDQVEQIEINIQQQNFKPVRGEIYKVKRSLRELNKAIIPLREAINKFVRSDNVLIEKRNRPFLRDLHDHISDAVDYLDTYRETLINIQDLYSNEIGIRTNQIMQVLTIIATIFIPLTFIVGVYGMNFQYIPELEFKYGYFVVWGVMIIVTLSLILFFRRKNWL